MRYDQGWLILTLISLSVSVVFAQEEPKKEKPTEDPGTTTIVEDTLQLQQGAIGVNKPGTEAPDTIVIDMVADRHSPRRAALYSAVLPGLGQAYNGKSWKIPIIYGGFITMGYFIIRNDDRYRLYLRAEDAIRNGEINPLAGLSRSDRYDTIEEVERFASNERRNRDFMIILTAGLYGLNIMDAIADAHLIEFDVNPDLSFNLEPMAGSALAYHDHLTPTLPAYGFSFTLSLY